MTRSSFQKVDGKGMKPGGRKKNSGNRFFLLGEKLKERKPTTDD